MPHFRHLLFANLLSSESDLNLGTVGMFLYFEIYVLKKLQFFPYGLSN